MADAEHVRMIKVWRNHNATVTIPHELVSATEPQKIKRKLFDRELPFLHPVLEIIVVIRKVSEMGNSIEHTAKPSEYNQQARTKNYFAFQGGGHDPNVNSLRHMVKDLRSLYIIEPILSFLKDTFYDGGLGSSSAKSDLIDHDDDHKEGTHKGSSTMGLCSSKGKDPVHEM